MQNVTRRGQMRHVCMCVCIYIYIYICICLVFLTHTRLQRASTNCRECIRIRRTQVLGFAPQQPRVVDCIQMMTWIVYVCALCMPAIECRIPGFRCSPQPSCKQREHQVRRTQQRVRAHHHSSCIRTTTPTSVCTLHAGN